MERMQISRLTQEWHRAVSSLWCCNIFINTLVRLITATGQALGISHGLDRIDQFNNLAFCGDLTLFAQSGAGAQQLINVIEQFERWSGIKVSLQKTVIMVLGEEQVQLGS